MASKSTSQSAPLMEGRLASMIEALSFRGQTKALETLIDEEIAVECRKRAGEIGFSEGDLYEALTDRHHEKRNTKVLANKVTVTVDHPGAQYIPEKVLPRISAAAAVSKGVARLMAKSKGGAR